MPYKPRHPCYFQGCPNLVPPGESACKEHRPRLAKIYNDARVESFQHLYNAKRWKALRLQKLRANPLCEHCQNVGRVTEAVIADHIVPHKGDRGLFYDYNNLQSLCRKCDDIKRNRYDGGWGNKVKAAAE